MRCLNEVTGRETDEATVGEGKKSWNPKFEREIERDTKKAQFEKLTLDLKSLMGGD